MSTVTESVGEFYLEIINILAINQLICQCLLILILLLANITLD